MIHNLLTEAIVDDYVTRRQSIPTIAAARGMPRSTVRKRLVAAGVTLRSRADGFALAIMRRRGIDPVPPAHGVENNG